MNILNLYKFKKKIGQNYLIFNLKFKFDLCSGYNYFNYNSNEIDFLKIKFIKNKIYLKKKKNFYCNFLLFNFFFFKIININISFNIIKIFLKKIKKTFFFFFKIITDNNKIILFKKKFKIYKIKFYLKKFFFPYPKINIIKLFLKKNTTFFYTIMLNIIKVKKLKIEKIKKYIYNFIIKIKNNVLFTKI
ncbi:MAG: hypothetical protein NVS84_00365 [Candidatus Carsonella ruddii]|nr:MAG: hypothetical protein NVS84_00365 [Candidatus Carsonella ruddii]WMC19524.1 MAG: hypothetical protein NVS85_00360 [Candidatus Carsonella ruddii]